MHVEVVSGADAGSVHTTTSEHIVIGTHRTADVVLADPTVSPFHLELVLDRGVVTLRDLGSRSGTLLDGVEIEVCRLRGPAIVSLGNTALRIAVHGDAAPVSLAPQERFGDLVGAAPVMRRAFAQLDQIALRDGHVLIEGERGTGKDLAAAHLHELGPRRDAPLDVVDCSAPALEVERALFGRASQPGALHRCHGGTIVLDEVGSLGRGTQRLLARALAERVVRPPNLDAMRADVRVLALSRRNLRIDVNADRFAPELYDLIAGARVCLPPLREHVEDIPLLVARAIDELEATGSRAASRLLAAESLDALRAAAWPGNVSELRAYVERALVADGDPDARDRRVRTFERTYLSQLLEATGGNVSAAAVRAGVDRVHLHGMITRCGLREVVSTARAGRGS